MAGYLNAVGPWAWLAALVAPIALCHANGSVTGRPNIAPGPLSVPGEGFVLLDEVRFGEASSERAHALVSDNSQAQAGALGEPCRVVLPRRPEPEFSGGSVTFTLRCDPAKQNYVTLKLWGSDVGETTLYLYHDGDQIGAQYSDWPPLDKLNWRQRDPAFEGRFFYTTYLLPWHITKGCQQVTLQLVSKGYLYGYAPTYEQAVHVQKDPSRGLYAAYTHTNPFFVPAESETRGSAPVRGAIRPAPEGLSAYEHVRQVAQRRLNGVYGRKPRPNPPEIMAIGMAYELPWSEQYHDADVLDTVVRTADWNVLQGDHKGLGWMGHGELAEAVYHTYDAAQQRGLLDSPITEGAQLTRRQAYAEFFRAGIDFRTRRDSRGGITNQDIYIITSVYRCQRLLKRLAPRQALPDRQALDLVHQAVGLRPYDGRRHRNGYNDRPVTISTAYRFIIGGPVFFSDDWDHYWVTSKGSSREHGYVQGYGEMAYQLATLVELTGDAAVREQAIKMIRARAPFRVPGNDAEGYRALRIEAAIGWRHSWYPGQVQYGDPYLKAAAVLKDPVSVRLAQLYLAHNQVFVKDERPHDPLMVDRVDHLKTVEALAPSEFRFPMQEGQPDFAWADEGIGAVVFRHKGRKAWIAMGWRGAGINNIARIHYTTQDIDRIANVRIQTRYTPSGYTITRPAERCGPFVPKGTPLATDGEVLPIAEGSLGGRGDLYVCRYGDYFIVMNTTADRSIEPDIPDDLKGASGRDLLTGRPVTLNGLQVPPLSTLVLYVDE